jgi:alkanesulfonate monooxygenase SsuD/methylene tetrahydromethanopterin reductase-like flavin-dependent oxidoreductase (luciferase family)
MKYGITVPNFGDYFDARAFSTLASDAEDAGWDGLFVWDHIHGDTWMRAPMADPWTLLTAAAMTTSRMRLGPMVTPLARRRAHVVARQSVTLDHLTGGRLTLGVGLGHPAGAEFEAFGEEGNDLARARRLDESLEVLTGLWAQRPFSYDGSQLRVNNVSLIPGPLQQPGIPIWCAAMLPSRAPLRRAAKWDGIVPLRIADDGSPALLSPADIASIAAYARSQRPDGATFDIVVSGYSPEPSHLLEMVGPREEAGATWWFEDGVAYSSWDTGVPLGGIKELRERVAKGPTG